MSSLEKLDANSRQALSATWHADSATASLERWMDLCDRQDWGRIPDNLSLLINVFGASWYFTRFVFFRGPNIVELLDTDPLPALTDEAITRRLQSLELDQPPDAALEALRIVKNEIMLQILLAELQGLVSPAQMERALTDLAEQTLAMAVHIHSQHMAPQLRDHLGVLGMGRMAGHEMNFGSDLDLIVLYPNDDDRLLDQAARMVRSLLRSVSMAAPAGSLYEIDMRLRPHGAAGVLITSDQSFIEYHSADREIWQRQLMTRCRPVFDGGGLASTVLDAVEPHIYADYDIDHLRAEIRDMRARVEHELGSPAGRYELKRGAGGIMDVDFISHFLQLQHGHANPDLRTPSTREALQRLNQQKLLSGTHYGKLIQGYDFLKRMEGRLRVFDMKPISSIPREPERLTALARGMGYQHADALIGARQLLDDYQDHTAALRQVFDEVLHL